MFPFSRQRSKRTYAEATGQKDRRITNGIVSPPSADGRRRRQYARSTYIVKVRFDRIVTTKKPEAYVSRKQSRAFFEKKETDNYTINGGVRCGSGHDTQIRFGRYYHFPPFVTYTRAKSHEQYTRNVSKLRLLRTTVTYFKYIPKRETRLAFFYRSFFYFFLVFF